MKVTGTVRENRIPQFPLPQTHILKKTERDNFEYLVTNSKIVIFNWYDNSAVTVASNTLRIFPLNKVK